MFTRFSLGYRGLKVPTHGLLAPVAVLFTFLVLLIFSVVIEVINGLNAVSRIARKETGSFHTK
jgi:hypothetical protein